MVDSVRVGGNTKTLDVTLSLTAGAYADNDVLADFQEVTDVMRATGEHGYVHSIVVMDEDDNAQAFDVVFADANVSLGTESGAVSISDADARSILGEVPVLTSDYKDYIGSQRATIRNVGLAIKASAGTKSIFVGAVLRSGTPTYTASGIRLKIVVAQD